MATDDADDIHATTKRFIRGHCRKLTVEEVDWDNASNPTRSYNCMGYVLGVLKWWQPQDNREGVVRNRRYFWPNGIPHDESINGYVQAARTEGFEVCDTGEWEDGYEKITLFFKSVDPEKPFTHATRLIAPNRAESKLGPDSDIPHAQDALDDLWFYGTGRVHMRRRIMFQ